MNYKDIILNVLIGFIALEHLYFLWMEMFAWETVGKKTFKSLAPELFKPTKILAANQGLYNGFLAGGLVWTYFIQDGIWRDNIALFFLSCIAVAGIYGGITASVRIFYVQAIPAIIALGIIIIQIER